MKHIICILALLFASTIPCRFSFAQALKSKISENHLGASHTWGAYGGIYYAIPQKNFLRTNYDNAFPIINVDFPPIGLELGVLYRLTPAVDLMVDVGTRKHILRAKEGLQNEGNLRIFPASIAARHVWRFASGENPYLAFGGTAYWARFSSTLIITGEFDPTPIGEYGVVKNYFGIGALGEAGLLERFSENLYLDLGIRYDFTRLGNTKNGGLGNIGGLQLKLKTVLYF
jgi:hypothetical protein